MYLAFLSFCYRNIFKRIVFLFNPELVHTRMIAQGRALGKYAITRNIIRLLFHTANPKPFHLAGITIPHRVGLAAGFDYNADLPLIAPSLGFGFSTVGTVTLESYSGNTRPMLTRLPHSHSILVNKGLKNLGAKKVIQLLEPQKFTIPVGISIASTNKKFSSVEEQIQDIVRCFQLFEESNVQHSYYELNISCPNVHTGNGVFYHTDNLRKLLLQLQPKKIQKPIFAKLPINLSESVILGLVDTLIDSGITTMICGNLQTDRSTLTTEEQNTISSLKGNLSGRPTHSNALDLVRLLHSRYKNNLVIIGLGGIDSPSKAQEFIQAGASAVQLITGMIYEGPQLVNQINTILERESA